MFKLKNKQNVELFTPLLLESGKKERHEEINMDHVEDCLNKREENMSNPMSKNKIREKIANLVEKRNKLVADRNKNRILDVDSDLAAKKPEECKLYIISIVVPLVSLAFMLVILFAFIISPIIQGVNIMATEDTGASGHQHGGHLSGPDLSTVMSNVSSSVKKDGNELHSHHDHGDTHR